MRVAADDGQVATLVDEEFDSHDLALAYVRDLTRKLADAIA